MVENHDGTIHQGCINEFHEPLARRDKRYNAWYYTSSGRQLRSLVTPLNEADYAKFILNMRQQEDNQRRK